MKNKKLNNLFILLIVFASCGKPGNSTPDGNGTGGGGNGGDTGGNNNKTCTIAAISQVNSGSGAEFSLLTAYNSSDQVTKLVIYDSLNKVKNFEADFNYITKDSIKIDQYQYLILDTGGRVIRFATRSDISAPVNADHYLYEYTYNAQGYLATKNLFINGSTLPNFSTAYSYTNNLLTNCVMTAASSGNLKVLESNLIYDGTLSIKNWIYTFPDATVEYMYATVFNFGNHAVNPLKQVTTKIYNPSTGVLLDTWTTTYGNYVIDTNGHILSAEAKGDLQQGIASFYGKTNFYYSCQ
jgi:hypothetical protein